METEKREVGDVLEESQDLELLADYFIVLLPLLWILCVAFDLTEQMSQATLAPSKILQLVQTLRCHDLQF